MSEIAQGRLMTLLSAMEDGIYIVSPDFVVEFMNKAMVRLFGHGAGKKCFEVIAGRSVPCDWCKAEDVFNGESVRRTVRIDHVGRTFDLTELPLTDSSGVTCKLAIYRDITKNLDHEEALRATRQDFENLFKHVGCGVYFSTKEGKFLDANPALLSMLGYDSKEEFLQIDIASDLYARAEDRQRFMAQMDMYGRLENYPVQFKKRDGTLIHVALDAHARRNAAGEIIGYEGIIIDQTERLRMENELRGANAFFNKVISSSPNAIMAADIKGEIILWNRAAEEMLGYKAEEVIGKMNIVKVYPEGMARQVMKMLRSPDHGGRGMLRSYPLTALKRGGGVLEANLSAAILYDADGKEMATVGIMVDLGERLAMERKLQQTQQQLLQSEKLAAMGRLTSQIAHELNNPLYGIMNTLELLKTEVRPDSKRRRILEMALSETVRLTDMLKKMLIFSKPDQEQRQLTDINEILDELLLLTGKQLSEHDVKVKVELAENLPKVMASKNQLRQVFLNIISNARDAMPEGGLLTVRTEAKEGHVLAHLKDTGHGIKDEHKDKIFDTFFTTKESVKGVGLGLSVCYGFIRDHGGDILVHSQVGQGTTFSVLLPAHQRRMNMDEV